jgi:hypothetical protein
VTVAEINTETGATAAKEIEGPANAGVRASFGHEVAAEVVLLTKQEGG